MESKQPSTLTTAFVTGIAAVPAGLLIAWAKSKGLPDLSTEATQALTGAVAVSIGAASGWVVAILDSFVAAVVALNNAVANRAGSIVEKMGGIPKQGGFVRPAMLAVLLALSLVALPGCGLMPKGADIPVSQQLPPAAQAAQVVINQANYALASGYGFIRDGVRDGTVDPKQGRAWYLKLDDLKSKIDAAQGLLKQGSFDAAKAQAAATQALIKLLQDELVKAAAKKST